MPNYNSFANLIFDFGGVLLNIDTDRALQGFLNLGLSDHSVISKEFQEGGLFDCLEKGIISPDQFRSGIRKYLRLDVSDKDIDHAWNAMLLDLPIERLELLEKLKKNHRLFLLSNTNLIHWEAYMALIKEAHGVCLSDFFEQDYYSHNMGLRKPDPRIYQQVLNEKALVPGETLFIDDMLVNVEAARLLGMGGHYLDLPKGESILDLFD
jgi:putative hydrolase of the HAD superfamily